MFFTVVPWEGLYKLILIVSLRIATVVTQKRRGIESIVLMIDTECQDQYIKGIVLMSLLKHDGLSVVFLETYVLLSNWCLVEKISKIQPTKSTQMLYC